MTIAEMAEKLVRMGYKASEIDPRAGADRHRFGDDKKLRILNALRQYPDGAMSTELASKAGMRAIDVAQNIRHIPGVCKEDGIYTLEDQDLAYEYVYDLNERL